jgi:hypothetical protein
MSYPSENTITFYRDNSQWTNSDCDILCHSPPVELSSGQQKGAASYDSPIICVSCKVR